MRHSCIAHPTRERMIVIREWQVAACDGNTCAAALLSFFEYWHNIKLDQAQQAKTANEVAAMHGEAGTQDTSLWQWHTEEELERGIMIYKRRTIRDALEVLADRGFITISRNPNPRFRFDRTRHFMFHPETVNAWLRDHYEPADPDPDTMMQVDPIDPAKLPDREAKTHDGDAKTQHRHAETTPRRRENAGAIPETTNETTTEITDETTRESTSPPLIGAGDATAPGQIVPAASVPESASLEDMPPRGSPAPRKGRVYDADSFEYQTACLLARRIQANNPKANAVTEERRQAWANTVRLMVERDRRAPEDIERVLEWSQHDDFWCTTILSMNALRRHFERLWLQMHRRSRRRDEGLSAADLFRQADEIEARERAGASGGASYLARDERDDVIDVQGVVW